MKKMFLGMLALLVWGVASVHAQVTIGSEAPPTPGAVLDLQSGGSQGLLMPQVALTSASAWAPLAGNDVDGMTVFNLSDKNVNGLRGKGLYIWLNKRWNLLYHADPCDGAIIKARAFDYVDSPTPGDGAKAGGAENGVGAPWEFKILIPLAPCRPGIVCIDSMKTIFTNTGIDLCVYKANGNLGATTDWADAVNNCANGSYADGDAFAGWYLPNLRELLAIYFALGGHGDEGANPAGSDFTYIQTPSYVATTAEPMLVADYWSSTTQNPHLSYGFNFQKGKISNNGLSLSKYDNYQVRCVKRM